MTIRRYKNRILAFMVCASAVVAHSAVRLDELCVAVDGQREYSYSDKSAGFFYGMTGVDNWQDGNAGWNVAAKRVLAIINCRWTAILSTKRVRKRTCIRIKL